MLPLAPVVLARYNDCLKINERKKCMQLSAKRKFPRHTIEQRRSLIRWRFWRRNVALPYLFLLPFLFLFCTFFLLPLGYALTISLYSDRLVGGSAFVAGQNYVQVFHDAAFWDGVRRLLVYGIIQVPIMLGLALVFALLLDSGILRLRTLFRLGFFLPYAIPGVVSILLWGYLYGPTLGPLPLLANLLHLPPPTLFTTDQGMMLGIGNIVTWQYTGYNMIIMYAALQAVPPELYDAALVDGANGWTIARYIKVPLVVPAIILTCVFSIIGTLQMFTEPQLLQPILPGVVTYHYTPNLYSYTLAFTNLQYNYSAAISFTLGAIVFVCSYIFMIVTNRGRLR